MVKKSIIDFQKMKKDGIKLTWLTSYDYPTAMFAEKSGIEMLLVGDSMGMCVYGYQAGTLPVTMEQCIVHTEAVRRGAPNTFIMGDMPFLSYQTTPAEAVKNAGRFYSLCWQKDREEHQVPVKRCPSGSRDTPWPF